MKSIIKKFIYIWENYKILWRAITVLFAVFIFILCVTGIENFPKSLFFLDFIDVVYHFGGFCLFSFFLRGAFYNREKAFLHSLITGLIWGIICETVQLFLPTRSFTLADLTANLGGILIVQLFLNKLLSFVRS